MPKPRRQPSPQHAIAKTRRTKPERVIDGTIEKMYRDKRGSDAEQVPVSKLLDANVGPVGELPQTLRGVAAMMADGHILGAEKARHCRDTQDQPPTGANCRHQAVERGGIVLDVFEALQADDVVRALASLDERLDGALLDQRRIEPTVAEVIARCLHDAFTDVDTADVVAAFAEPRDHVASSAPDIHDGALLKPSCEQVAERIGAKIGASRFGKSDLLSF
jgi:hypothetical protein